MAEDAESSRKLTANSPALTSIQKPKVQVQVNSLPPEASCQQPVASHAPPPMWQAKKNFNQLRGGM